MNPLTQCLGLTLSLVLANSLPSGAQILSQGDIAITGYQSTSASDTFCFVVLRPEGIDNGTTINFTDNGWNINNVGNTNEGIISWTAAQNLNYGDQVSIWLGSAKGSLQGAVSNVNGTMSLAAGGDQIIAFQGTWTSSPTMLCGLHFNTSTQTTAADWDGSDAVENHSLTSKYPPLPAGYAVWVKDPETPANSKTSNGYYHGLLYDDPDVMRSHVNSNSAWTYSSITSGNPGWSLPFPLVRATESTISVTGVTATEICTGALFKAYFNTTGTFSPDNRFILALTSENLVGELQLAQGTTSDSLSIYLPDTLPENTYSLKIKSTDPALESSTISLLVRSSTPLIVGENPAVCEGEQAVALDFISPSGGSYSGAGVSANAFDPSGLQPGNHSVNYSFTNDFGCVSSTSEVVVINPKPSLQIDSYSDACQNAEAFLLQGNPDGGSFSGNAVSDGYFNPAIASIGDNGVSYSYTDHNGCSNSVSGNIKVLEVPQIQFLIPAYICLGDSLQLNATPSGGQYSGEGISGNKFSSNGLTAGYFPIIYKYTNNLGCSAEQEQVIEVKTLPNVSFTIVDSICADALPFSLNGGIPSDGIYSGNFITDGKFYSSLSGSGTFPVLYTVTDQYGCSASAASVLVVKTVSGMMSGDSLSVCEHSGEIILSEHFAQYSNFSGNGVDNGMFYPNNMAPGLYQIDCSYHANGCSGNIFVKVAILPLPTPNLSGPENWQICPETATTLNGPDSFQLYRWFKDEELLPESGSSLLAAEAGDYRLEVMDLHGCSGSSETYNLSTYNLVKPIFIWPEFPETCLTAPTLLSFSGTQAINWYLGNSYVTTDSQLPVEKSGLYKITTTDEHGCSVNSDPVAISILTPPQINKLNSSVICRGDSVVLVPSWGEVSAWFFNNQTLFTSSTCPAKDQGQYKVMVEDEYGCQIMSHTFDLTVNELPDPKISVVGNDSLCTGEKTILQTGQYKSYSWLYNGLKVPGSNYDKLTLSKAGVYWVKVTDENSCSNVSAVKKITVISVQEPLVDKNGVMFRCETDTLELNCLNCQGEDFAWYRNDTLLPNETTTLQVANTGNYRIRMTEWKCEANSKTAIVIDVANPDKPEIRYENGWLFSSSSNNNQWYFNDTEIPNATDNKLEITTDGNYSVSVESKYGCTSYSDLFEVQTSGISSQTVDELTVYPNPANDFLWVNLTLPGQFTLYSVLGEAVLNCKLFKGRNTVAVPYVHSGTYLMHILLDNGTVHLQKIEVQNR